MNVFISWSGKTSGELAKVLRDWLPSVIQAVKPYFSTDDIEKGARGNTMLAQELEEASIGILCLTRENLEASWIMFEAGALSKSLDKSRVCPLLFGELSTTDLQGPLTNFQAAKFNKEEMQKVMSTINTQLDDTALAPNVLEAVFEKWWPELEQKVQEILSRATENTRGKIRKDRDLLEEILTLVRQIFKKREKMNVIYPEEMSPLFSKFQVIIDDLGKYPLLTRNIKAWANRWCEKGYTIEDLKMIVFYSKKLSQGRKDIVFSKLSELPADYNENDT